MTTTVIVFTVVFLGVFLLALMRIVWICLRDWPSGQSGERG